jgi:hypothetical protein
MNTKPSPAFTPCRLNQHFPAFALGLAGFLPCALSAAEPKFEAQTIDPNIQIGYGLEIGDVDGDGDQDILLADKRDFWWYENPSWEKKLFHTFHEGEKRTQLRDNVCLAARDIDGDGKVEVAVGGNWNPGNTESEEESGSVHFLGSLGKITPVQLPHEPTTHRMRWVRTGADKFALVVLPLHGRGNQNGDGENGVAIFAYEPPADPAAAGWKTTLLSKDLHRTHTFDSIPSGGSGADLVVVGGYEGARALTAAQGKWSSLPIPLPDMKDGAGEIRIGQSDPASPRDLYATIEPMHGDTVAVYTVEGAKPDGAWKRTVLDESLAQGHALAVADVLGAGSLQVIAGWREKNKDGKVGVKLYAQGDDGVWSAHWIHDDKMACEDLKVADLNKDGKPDIISCGRATRNVVVYWNKN